MIAVVLLAGVSAAMAQKDVKALGVNVNYGSEIKNVGIGAKFQYGLTDAIRVEPSFNYYLKKDGVSLWDANVNFHYLFDVADKIKVYPLAGIGLSHWGTDFGSGYDDDDEDWSDWSRSRASYDDDYGYDDDEEDYDDSSSSNELVVNLGVGAQYQLNDKWSIGAELKYQIINNYNQIVFGVGVAYKF